MMQSTLNYLFPRKKRVSSTSVKVASFEVDYTKFSAAKEHAVHPFLSENDWSEYKDSQEYINMLDQMGQKRFLEVVEKYTLPENMNIVPASTDEELRIVIIGKTGVGKSATANTILGDKVFEDDDSAGSVTSKSRKHCKKINGRRINVIDTPGLHDTHKSKEDIHAEIGRVMKIFTKGVHAFIYVHDISNPRFTEENKQTLELIEDSFGGGIKDFRLLVYSKADNLKSNLEEFRTKQMKDENQAITPFLRELDWRIVAINNCTTVPAEKKRNQDIILALVDKLRLQQGNKIYSNDMFKEADKKRQEFLKKGKEKNWNEAIMDAVDAVIGADPDVVKDKKKFNRCIHQHLEGEALEIENELREARQKREEEELTRIAQEEEEEKERKERMEKEWVEKLQKWEEEKKEKEKQFREEQEKIGRLRQEQYEEQMKRREREMMNNFEALRREQQQQQEEEIRERQRRQQQEEAKHKRKMEEQLEQLNIREQEERRKQEEKVMAERAEKEQREIETMKAKQKEQSMQAQLDELKNLLKIEREERKKMEIVERNEQKKVEEERRKKLESEWQERIQKEREEARLLLEKEQKAQAKERKRAEKERQRLIEENERQLKVTKEALANANKVQQAQEIANEHEGLLRSAVGTVKRTFSRIKKWFSS